MKILPTRILFRGISNPKLRNLGTKYFLLTQKNYLGSFSIFDDPNSNKFLIKFPYGDYNPFSLSYDQDIDFQVLETLSKMSHFYRLDDFRSALAHIDDLNKTRPDWVRFWPAYSAVITFFSILQRNKHFELIINYYSIFEKQGLNISGKLFQQILISYIHTKNFENASQLLAKYHDVNVPEDFIPQVFGAIFKSIPLPAFLNSLYELIKIIPVNIELRETAVNQFISYLTKIPCVSRNRNKSIPELLQSDDFKYVILLFKVIQGQRYELSSKQTSMLMNWFKNYFKDRVFMRVTKIHGENWSRCCFCGYPMEKIPAPANGKIFKEALTEVVLNVKKVISNSNLEIQNEFRRFDIFVKKNFPLFSIIDYSNLRKFVSYGKSLRRVDPNDNSYSNVKLWEEYSQFWYPLLNYCPNDLKVGCVAPMHLSVELRFLYKNSRFVVFTSRFLTEDILCIYACALTYLNLMDTGLGEYLIPKIISMDRFENFYQLAPINSVVLKRWFYQIRGFIMFENDKYRFTCNSYERIAQMGEDSMHFPVKGGNWLCIQLKN